MEENSCDESILIEMAKIQFNLYKIEFVSFIYTPVSLSDPFHIQPMIWPQCFWNPGNSPEISCQSIYTMHSAIWNARGRLTHLWVASLTRKPKNNIIIMIFPQLCTGLLTHPCFWWGTDIRSGWSSTRRVRNNYYDRTVLRFPPEP